MKAVLLAGGFGTRMKEETEFRPKPMVEVGGRPVLWHIMKWFASSEVTDFVILTGYKSDYIKQYFANYRTNNFDFEVVLGDPDSLRFMGSHEETEWRVTILDTGYETPTGGRIKAAESLLREEPFYCTYGDGIASVDVPELARSHLASKKIATVTVSKPVSRFGELHFDKKNRVTDFVEKPQSSSWVSIGYFVFSRGIFDYLVGDSVLEDLPMRELVAEGQLNAFPHEGFWQPMDTQREYEHLKRIWDSGQAPWAPK